MATSPFITQAVAQDLLTSLETDLNAGTAAVIEGYNGSAPAFADSAEGNTLLFSLTCSASIFVSKTDGNPGAIGTFDTITQDSSADATGTLSHFRIKTQTGGTSVFQGSAGTSSADMIVNTVSITSGSVVAATGTSTITVPEG